MEANLLATEVSPSTDCTPTKKLLVSDKPSLVTLSIEAILLACNNIVLVPLAVASLMQVHSIRLLPNAITKVLFLYEPPACLTATVFDTPPPDTVKIVDLSFPLFCSQVTSKEPLLFPDALGTVIFIHIFNFIYLSIKVSNCFINKAI